MRRRRRASKSASTICFIVVFWGEKYRRYFLEYCLASLLAPDNLPFMLSPDAAGVKGKLFICSTEADYAALALEPLFQVARQYVEPVFIDIGPPGGTPPALHMSKGHNAALEICMREKNYCSVLAPDIILSNGSIRTIINLVARGAAIALFPAFRFDLDDVRKRLCDEGFLVTGQSLSIESRVLATVAADCLHSEIRRYDFDSSHFADHPISTIFRRREGGWILHTSSWGFAVLDLSLLTASFSAALESDTIDAHFIDTHIFNRAEFADPVILNDSDDFLMVPLTTEAEMPLKHYLRPDPLFQDRTAQEIHELKVSYIRSFIFSHWCDPFKRWAYRIPVFLHPEPLGSEPDPTVERARLVIEQASAVQQVPAPIYLLVAISDAEQYECLCTFLLLSLQAPRNAPVLAGIPGCRLLIAAPSQLAAKVSERPEFIRLSYFLPIEFLEVGGGETLEPAHVKMARALALCSERCIRDNVFGCFLWPDIILSNGAIQTLLDSAVAGYEGVVATLPEFDFDGRLHRNAKIVDGRPIVLSPRELIGYVLDGVRPTLIRPGWDTIERCYWPQAFVAEADRGFVMHSPNWAVALCDFRVVRQPGDGTLHEDASRQGFKKCLFEAYKRGKLHIVSDSDQLLMVSMFYAADVISRRVPQDRQAQLYLSRRSLVASISSRIRSDSYDEMRQALFYIPILFHAEELSPSWARVCDDAARSLPVALVVPTNLKSQISRVAKSGGLRSRLQLLAEEVEWAVGPRAAMATALIWVMGRVVFLVRFAIGLTVLLVRLPLATAVEVWVYRGAIARRLLDLCQAKRGTAAAAIARFRSKGELAFRELTQLSRWDLEPYPVPEARFLLQWDAPRIHRSKSFWILLFPSPRLRYAANLLADVWLHRPEIRRRIFAAAKGDRESVDRIVLRVRSVAQQLRLIKR